MSAYYVRIIVLNIKGTYGKVIMKFFCKLSNWYFSSKSLPYWGVLFLDCLIVFFAGYVSGYLEHGGLEFAQHFWSITAGNILCVLLFAVAFRLFHTYSGILRYSSLVDLERVGMASFVGVCMSYVLGAVLDAFDVENVVMPSLFGCTVMFVCASMLMWVERMFVRAMFDVFKSDKALPVAIYGTQNGGVSLANSIMLMKDQPYMLQAFISDGDDMRKTYLLGKKVFLNQKGIAAIMKALHVKVLFVSPLKSDDFRNNQQMVDEFVQAGIKIMMMTAAEEWDGKSDLSFNQLHEIEIEDLLPRDKIEVDMNAIGAMLKGKRVLITGAAGSIGSEMVRQVAVYKPAELTLIDQAETPMHSVRLTMARQERDYSWKHHRQGFHGEDIRRSSSRIRVPCSGLQACADDGRQSCNGCAQQRERHSYHRRPCREVRHQEVCDDFNRQGCKSYKRNGMFKAYLRDLLPVAQ